MKVYIIQPFPTAGVFSVRMDIFFHSSNAMFTFTDLPCKISVKKRGRVFFKSKYERNDFNA